MDKPCSDKLKNAFNNLEQIRDYHPTFFEQYYVDRSSCYLIDEVVGLCDINDKPHVILFGGQVGTGKTTELHHIKHTLEKQKEKEFEVIFLSPFRNGIFSTKLEYSDIAMGIFSDFLLNIPKNIEISDNVVAQLEELLELLEEGGEVNYTKGNVRSIAAGFFSLFTLKLSESEDIRRNFRVKTAKNMKKMLDLFDEILDAIRNNNGTPKYVLVIIDDLEKIGNEKAVIDVLNNHKNLFVKRKCSFIITVNNSIQFDREGVHALEQFRNYTLPFVAVRDQNREINEDELKKMIEIIGKRVPPEIIDTRALRLAILFSGGSLSELFRLYQNAINKARTSDQCLISLDLIKKAFATVKPKANYIALSEFEKLRTIYRSNDSFSKLDPKDKRDYLYTCVLMTYKDFVDDTEWYDLNPAFLDEFEWKKWIDMCEKWYDDDREH